MAIHRPQISRWKSVLRAKRCSLVKCCIGSHSIIVTHFCSGKVAESERKSCLSLRLQMVYKRLNRIQSKFRASPSNTAPPRFLVEYQEGLHKTEQTLYLPAPNRASTTNLLCEGTYSEPIFCLLNVSSIIKIKT